MNRVVYLVLLVKSENTGAILNDIHQNAMFVNIKQSTITSHMC